MTSTEAYNALKGRVEWQKPLDTAFSFLTFSEPESNRFLQEEHAAIRIPIIYEMLYSVDISDADFQTQLAYLKEKAIRQMLHDVFYDRKIIEDYYINENEMLFDYAIILKCTVNVLFDILNSTRINYTEKVTEDNIKRWFIDLNGLKDTENGVYVQGFIERYKREIARIRKSLFLKNKSLKVVTAR